MELVFVFQLNSQSRLIEQHAHKSEENCKNAHKGLIVSYKHFERDIVLFFILEVNSWVVQRTWQSDDN